MSFSRRSLLRLVGAGSAAAIAAGSRPSVAQTAREVRIDWATYNPVSLVLKDRKILETALAPDGIGVRWVQSLGSNKALEFLNAEAVDFGSTAGSAALLARINGNPIKSVYVYSRPEWTALVTRKQADLRSVADLKGRSVAATRGTDPHIFLIRALAEAGLSERDVKLVILQHGDGRLALDRGDVDAWAGLDPIMAAAEIENGDVLFYRNAELNTPGILNVRESFASQNPELVRRVLAAYEEARRWSLANRAELKRIVARATRLPPAVVDRQIDDRTDLTDGATGAPRPDSIKAAGLALQKAGIVEASVDVGAAVDHLIDTRFLGSASH